MSTRPILIRPMQADDVPAMLAVQAQCYPPHMNEPADVLLARWQACGDTAWVACDAQGQVQAYLVGHRSWVGCVSPLGDVFSHAECPNALYLHDLAIGDAARGQGVAQTLVSHALSLASQEGLSSVGLVSVNGSEAFWQRMGFKPLPVSPEAQAHLSTYPGSATYMVQ